MFRRVNSTLRHESFRVFFIVSFGYMISKPIELWSNRVISQKINDVHQNPVEAGLVFRAENYRFSSAIDYCDKKGLLDYSVVFRMFDL